MLQKHHELLKSGKSGQIPGCAPKQVPHIPVRLAGGEEVIRCAQVPKRDCDVERRAPESVLHIHRGTSSGKPGYENRASAADGLMEDRVSEVVKQRQRRGLCR